MSKINTAEIVLKSANVDDIKTRINKIKISTEKITDEYKKLKGPNNCGLYGENLNNLKKEEVKISEKLAVVSDAYTAFEDALTKYESSEAKVIADIKVPKIVDSISKGAEPVTEPKTSPKTDPEPMTGPQITPSSPDAPKGGEPEPKVQFDQVGTGVKPVILTSPDPQNQPEQPQEPTPPDQNAEAFAEPPSEMPTMPEPPSEPEPPTQPQKPDLMQEQAPSVNGINDQIDIPLVEKSEVEPVKGKSNDGIILAGGIAAVGGLAFGAVQGISALEKKNEDDKEKEKKKKDGKFIIKNEGDR